MRWFLPAMRMLNLRGVALLDLSGWGGVAVLCARTRGKPSSARCEQRLSDGSPLVRANLGGGGAEFPFIVRAPDRSAVCRKAIPYASLKTSS